MVNIPSFDDINLRREVAGFTRQQLLQRAGVDASTWTRTARGATAPNVQTLLKLKAALDEMIEERVQALIYEGSSL